MKSGGRFPAEPALKPIGAALAAVVAGLGVSAPAADVAEAAPAEPLGQGQEHTRQHYVDHTNHPSFEEDPSLILGPSEPVAPFSTPAETAKPKQSDLFDL